MRVLLSTIGSRGDVQPLVALALQVKALGHEVRLCVPPDFQEWLEGLGIPVTPIGPPVRAFAAGKVPAAQASPSDRRSLAEESVATQFETIAAAAQGCDVILGATALQIAGPSVAESMGIPYVFAAFCPVVLPSPHHAPPVLPPVPGQAPAAASADNGERWARDAERFNDLFGPALNSHRIALGLSPVSDVRSHVFTARPWLAADPTLAPWPDPADWSVLQTGAWIMPDERPLAPELVTFLDADEEALFTRVAAVVHHAGAGTTTAAAFSGSPQVVVPQWYDQPYFAQRVHDLGIGVAHVLGVPTTESLTSALRRALESDVTARARSIAAAVRRDGAYVAAQALIESV